MTKITATADGCRILRADALPEINKALEPFGITATLDGNLTYDRTSTISCKVVFAVIGDGQSAEDAALEVKRKDWNRRCFTEQLKPEDFGKTITLRGRRFKIIGFSTPRSSKILIQGDDGKNYTTDGETARRALVDSLMNKGASAHA